MLPGPPKKAARKRHTEAIKQSREERCRRLPIAKASGLCLRVPTATAREQERSRTPSVPKADACVARELWCFAGCLSPILPPIAHATRRGRCVYVPFVPLPRLPYLRFCAARVHHARRQTHQSACSCCTAVVSARHAVRVAHLYAACSGRSVHGEIRLSWRFQPCEQRIPTCYAARGPVETACAARKRNDAARRRAPQRLDGLGRVRRRRGPVHDTM